MSCALKVRRPTNLSQAAAPGSAEPEWISAKRAARIIDCNYRHIPVFASKGLLTVRRLPVATNKAVTYLRSDCERLARDVVTPASARADQAL